MAILPASELARKLLHPNDSKRFPERKGEGLEMRRQTLEPTITQLRAAGPAIIPYLLPLTYNFSWACLLIPELLYSLGTDESIRLLAELSMFRLPYFAQSCLAFLEQLGARAIPQIMPESKKTRPLMSSRPDSSWSWEPSKHPNPSPCSPA